ncbi:M20/M25/M40 family metallo-hydrolase [Heliobacterium mobile]|nr:M20/M25/M40 family metallo-hydrolase [Heliobacterium mobile]
MPDPRQVSMTSNDGNWQQVIVRDTSELIKLETWRMSDGSNEEVVIANLVKIKDFFIEKMNDFNNNTPQVKMSSFEWKGQEEDKKYWVFGFRAGTGERKVSLICHLDTVPPGNSGWQPFVPRQETRLYKGVPTPFLIGRGSIDDKGPAVVAFESFSRALKKAAADPQVLNKVTLEVLFDTSEETDMSTPKYFAANPNKKPSLGIVFDAFWSVRAEKGIERPVFTVNASDVLSPLPDKLTIEKLSTPDGSVNMIPVTAEARIKGPDELLDEFYKKINDWYRTCPFDDPDYHPADINVTYCGSEVVITTKVAGAQHGSAPHQNRSNGANPVVSLTNFLAFLIDRDILANNHRGEMCRFIRWAFGTRAFGEHHPDLLKRFDTVFGDGNGTTYGLTQLTDNESEDISLGIDIRYVIGHHGKGWDGREGQIDGDSLFNSVFDQLINRYQSETGGARISFKTESIFGPDIRSIRNADLFKINMAYRSIMGDNCPMQAIGGATDAHGRLELITAGALFTDNLGPPVNYHGIDEGAPLTDLENSGKILLYLLTQELGTKEEQESSYSGFHQCHGCCN